MTRLSMALLSIGFLIGLLTGSVFRPPQVDLKPWEHRVSVYQQDSVAFERVIAMLHGERVRQDDSVRVLHEALVVAVSKAKTAKARADTVIVQLPADTTTADSLKTVLAAYEARTEEAHELTTALGNAVQESIILRGVINTQDSIIATVTKRLAIADDLLRDHPKPKGCRLICPSPVTTFVIGAVAGAAGMLYLTK